MVNSSSWWLAQSHTMLLLHLELGISPVISVSHVLHPLHPYLPFLVFGNRCSSPPLEASCPHDLTPPQLGSDARYLGRWHATPNSRSLERTGHGNTSSIPNTLIVKTSTTPTIPNVQTATIRSTPECKGTFEFYVLCLFAAIIYYSVTELSYVYVVMFLERNSIRLLHIHLC